MAGFFTGFVNWLIKAFGGALIWCLGLFPDTPFSSPNSAPGDVNLGWVTWVLDFPTWIAHFALILSAFAVYYAVRIAARWLKLVRE
jgi:hypothetical protein